MNLLIMTREQRLDMIRGENLLAQNERMGNAPITEEADYMSFILEAYDADVSEDDTRQ
ncbi:MAG: hypothetical protein FWC16_00980 [Defluviitaleaceae bacterium]|nr:hypothetical protein [Defluviitaleaceae bacterium]MCL2273478.1 hypothetical protein [Defluviitaleaceae bacterium]